jgi:hypothetical protein
VPRPGGGWLLRSPRAVATGVSSFSRGLVRATPPRAAGGIGRVSVGPRAEMERAAEQADAADEAQGGTRTAGQGAALCPRRPDGRGHRFAADPQCSPPTAWAGLNPGVSRHPQGKGCAAPMVPREGKDCLTAGQVRQRTCWFGLPRAHAGGRPDGSLLAWFSEGRHSPCRAGAGSVAGTAPRPRALRVRRGSVKEGGRAYHLAQLHVGPRGVRQPEGRRRRTSG